MDWITPRQALKAFDVKALDAALEAEAQLPKSHRLLELLRVRIEFKADEITHRGTDEMKTEIPGLNRSIAIIRKIQGEDK